MANVGFLLFAKCVCVSREANPRCPTCSFVHLAIDGWRRFDLNLWRVWKFNQVSSQLISARFNTLLAQCYLLLWKRHVIKHLMRDSFTLQGFRLELLVGFHNFIYYIRCWNRVSNATWTCTLGASAERLLVNNNQGQALESGECGNGNFTFEYLKLISCLFTLKFLFVNICNEKETWHFYSKLKQKGT